MSVADYLRGRCTIMEIMDFPMRLFHTLLVQKFQMSQADVEKETAERIKEEIN